jgi:catechol 2,3-dioxygenase-like lactoylglutathione lyase family enzyme
MIDHVGFPVSDYARSKAFYEKALAPLGYTLIMQVTADHTESGSPAAGFGKAGKPDFWVGGHKRVYARLRRALGGLKGILHIAIATENRATVDVFHRAALAAGGKDNGAPGLRPHYHANYYGAFVLDPDGHNIEAVCHAPA